MGETAFMFAVPFASGLVLGKQYFDKTNKQKSCQKENQEETDQDEGQETPAGEVVQIQEGPDKGGIDEKH